MPYQISRVQSSKVEETDVKTLLEVWITDPTLVSPIPLYAAASFDDEGWSDDNFIGLVTDLVNLYPALPYDAYLTALL